MQRESVLVMCLLNCRFFNTFFKKLLKCVSVFRASGGEPAFASGAHPPCSGVPVLQSAAPAHVTSAPHLTVAHHDNRTGENWSLLTTASFSHFCPYCMFMFSLTFTCTHSLIHSGSGVSPNGAGADS